MKRQIIGVLVSMFAAAALVAAQAQGGAAPAPKMPQTQKAPDTSLTGCLIQGSSPTVFLLDNARHDPKDKTEKAARYALVAGTEDLNFARHLNHEVTIAGAAEQKTVPAGQKIAEKDLPKLTAKQLTMVSDTCTAASR
jgi:hypothetical protein